MQLRFATTLSAQQYMRQQAWKDARLDNCPLHSTGVCGFARHGTYPRKFPPNIKIPRWYCRKARQTFSLLPDFLASRLSGTLIELEDVINKVENSPSQESAVQNMRIYIELAGFLDQAASISSSLCIDSIDRTFTLTAGRMFYQHLIVSLGSGGQICLARTAHTGQLLFAHVTPAAGLWSPHNSKKNKKKSFPTPNGH